MNMINFILTPVIGSVIASSTNWLAIRMLFRPHVEKRIFGIKIPFTPGLIPKERKRLTAQLSKAISEKLLTPEVLAAELSNITMWQVPDITIGEVLKTFGVTEPASLAEPIGDRIKIAAEGLLSKVITALETFPESHPELDNKLAAFTYKVIDENMGKLAGMFISKEKIYASIKAGITGYLTNPENKDEITAKIHEAIDAVINNENNQTAIMEKIYSCNIKDGLTSFLQKEKHTVSRVLEAIAGYIATHMPIQAMIENKMNSFDIAEAEEIILSVVGRELKVIVLLGGVLGFVIGLLAAFL